MKGRAVKLIDDVHVLARLYGWTERDVLSLRSRRRDAYLARIEQDHDDALMSSILGDL